MIPNTKPMETVRMLAAGALLGCACPIAAAPIGIVNSSFEDLYDGSGLPGLSDVPVGAFPAGPAPGGWSIYDEGAGINSVAFVGVLNPGTTADGGTNYPGGAPDGDNVLLLYTDNDTGGARYGVAQELSAALTSNTLYTLDVEVGNIASGIGLSAPWSTFGFYNLDGFPGYTVQLLAGGAVIAQQTNSVAPGEGQFATATLQFETGDNHAQLGSALEIRLINENQPDIPGVRGLEVNFDDVRLDATAVSASAPASAGLAALGLMAALWRSRHRRVRGTVS